MLVGIQIGLIAGLIAFGMVNLWRGHKARPDDPELGGYFAFGAIGVMFGAAGCVVVLTN